MATNKQNYQIKKMVGDGNCLFRALSYYIHGTQGSHNRVRQQVVEYIYNNWNRYQAYIVGNQLPNGGRCNTAEQYAAYMGVRSTYGSEVEIRAFVDTYTQLHYNSTHQWNQQYCIWY